MTKRKKRPSSKRSTTSATESDTVIIVDELAEVEAEDPTFAGLRSMDALEDAYERVKEALRNAHLARFRHAPPAATLELFRELTDEVTLPHGEAVRRMIAIVDEGATCTPEERLELLGIVDEFCEQVTDAVR